MKILEEEITDQIRTPNLEHLKTEAENYVRTEPVKSVGAAAGAGLLFSLLPIGSILFGVLRLSSRLTFSLLRPALMFMGALALYKEVSRRANGGSEGDSFFK